MTTKPNNRQMSINLIAAIISFAVNAGINFVLSPYLVRSFGTDAYGFIGLANNFIQYASILTAALNSISGRFISVAYHQGNKEKASVVFSTVLVADIIIAMVLLVLSSGFVVYMDLFLAIPEKLIMSVKITFALTFLTFIISVFTAVFTTAAYVKNRIDINSIRDIISNLLKVTLIVALFTFFPAKLYFIAIASAICSIFLLLTNVSVKNKILPDVAINLRKFDVKQLKIILAAGIWMSLASLSNVLITGLDLLICNLTLGAMLMGILSISKTIPNCLNTLIVTLGNVFSPHYTILYAQEKYDELIFEVKLTSKIISLIMTVPLTGFIAFGTSFYTLWQPTRTVGEISMIQILSFLTCCMLIFSAHTQGLLMLYTTCNKMRVPVFVNLGIGSFSTILVLTILKTGYFGINGVYFIAGISSVLLCFKALIFMPVYSAYIMKKKWNTFYDIIIKGLEAFLISCVLLITVNHFVIINTWKCLLLVCGISGLITYCICYEILFSKSEKHKILKIIKRNH